MFLFNEQKYVYETLCDMFYCEASTPKDEAKDLGCWYYTGGGVLKDGKRTGIDKSMTTLICANDCAKLNFSYALVKVSRVKG